MACGSVADILLGLAVSNARLLESAGCNLVSSCAFLSGFAVAVATSLSNLKSAPQSHSVQIVTNYNSIM